MEAEESSDLFDHRFEVAGLIKDCLSAEDFLQEFEKRLPTLSSNDWMTGAKDNYFGGSPPPLGIFQEQM